MEEILVGFVRSLSSMSVSIRDERRWDGIKLQIKLPRYRVFIFPFSKPSEMMVEKALLVGCRFFDDESVVW